MTFGYFAFSEIGCYFLTALPLRPILTQPIQFSKDFIFVTIHCFLTVYIWYLENIRIKYLKKFQIFLSKVAIKIKIVYTYIKEALI